MIEIERYPGSLSSEGAWACVRRRCNEAPAGDFVECGVHVGGFSLLMAQYDRDLWMFDSWEGIPDDEVYERARRYRVKGPKHPGVFPKFVDAMKANNLLRDRLYFMKGWFKDTLPRYSGKIAVLVADGDLYSSTMDILENLYEKVVPGGFIVIDDMPLEGCRDAVMEFRKRMKITAPMFLNTDEPFVWDNHTKRKCNGTWWRA